MVLISHEHKFIFVKMPKCASSSIEEVLESYLLGTPNEGFGEEDRPERVGQNSYVSGDASVPRKPFLNPHVGCRELHSLMGQERFTSYQKASSVRNPWDQTVSLFWWRLRNYPKLNSLAQQLPMLVMKIWFSIWYFTSRSRLRKLSFSKRLTLNGELVPMHIVRYESINPGLSDLLGKLGCESKNLALPARKTQIRSRPEPFQKYYFGFVKDALARERSDDLKNFGYEWVGESATA